MSLRYPEHWKDSLNQTQPEARAFPRQPDFGRWPDFGYPAIIGGAGKPQPQENEEEERQLIPRFELGQLVATLGVLEVVERVGKQTDQEPPKILASLLRRHVTGDWGDLDEEDKRENEFSVEKGFRILSAYKLSDDTRVWIITEADRSATTFLLPAEY